jgi:iron complex outermembrane receptor protein
METTGSQTEVTMRGFNQVLSNKNLVLVNGRSVAFDLLGTTFWGTLPIGVEDIDRIEVVRGPGSALYGADAFNGVINIITKAPGDGKSGFSAAYGDHGTAHGSIWATGRDKELAYRMSAGYDYLPRWSNEANPNRQDAQLARYPQIDADTSQKTARINVDLTRDLGRGVKVALGGGYTQAQFQVGGTPPLTDVALSPETGDVTAALTSKNFEIKAFWNTSRGRNSLTQNYIGQSLLDAHFNLNVVNVEAQYIDDRQLGVLNNSLHLGLGYRFREAEWDWQDQQRSENFESAYVHDEAKFGKRFALVGDFRGDYVPYLAKFVLSPKGSILIHPSDNSTIRAIVATAFRIPNFLEAYLGIPVQLPFAGGSLASRGTQPDLVGPAFKLQPENVVTEELGYLNQDSDFFVFDSAVFHNYVHNLIELAANRPVTVGDLNNPVAGAGYDPQSGLYPLFFGGWNNQCEAFNVFGGEFGVRTFPAEGLDLYANYTLMSVKTDKSGCTAEQLAGEADDSRTSANKLNTGIQVRTKFNIDGSLDFHYVSPQDWALQVTDIQQQKVVRDSFHIAAYSLLNARLGYRLLKNQAEISAIAFNILNDQHREHPFGQLIGQRIMGMFTYRF